MQNSNNKVNQDRPLVSILVATFNGAEFVDNVLASITKTTYQNIEIIILDDSSDDETPEICNRWVVNDERVHFFRNERNMGIFPTYLKLFNLSTGKYVIWNDQDDLRDPTFIEKAVEILEQNPEAVLCHCHTMVSVRGINVHISKIDSIVGSLALRTRFWNLLRTSSDITIYGLISRNALLETQLWQERLGSCNLLLFELMQVGTFLQIDEILFFYSGKGYLNRPASKRELNRSVTENSGKGTQLPSFGILFGQLKGIWYIRRTSFPNKVLLSIMTFSYFGLGTFIKFNYRIIRCVLPITARSFVFRDLSKLVYSDRDIVQLVDREKFPNIYSRDFPLA